MQRIPKVLFLSTGNSSRSQMAEGFLTTLASGCFEAVSTGLQQDGANSLAFEVMDEVGIDISDQHPKSVRDSLKEHFAYVITLSDMGRERSPIFPFTPNLLHWSLTDPSLAEGPKESVKQTFRRVRDEISANVRQFLEQMKERDENERRARTA